MKSIAIFTILLALCNARPESPVNALITSGGVSGGYGSSSFESGTNTGGYDDSGSPLPSTIDGAHVDDSYSHVVTEIVDETSDDCSNFESDGYSCVPYYNCEAGEIVTDGGGLIDIRSNFGILDPSTSKCPGYLEVCCRHPDTPETTTKKVKITPPPPPPYQPQCGRRNTGGIGVKIQNSQYKGTTQFGEWPHMCAVLEKKIISYDEEVNLYVCGGSLIAPGIILTGAHCVQKHKAENLKVRCGEWDTQQKIEPKAHEDRDVRKVIMDPLFDPKNLHNDFALLFLSEDFELQPHIDTICLPDTLEGIHSYQQQNCIATGWGKDKFGKEGEYQVVMKQIEMDIVGHDECQEKLRSTRLGQYFKLDDSFICAGGEKDKDTCQGDGGGPLVCPAEVDSYGNPAYYVQAGIVAWGIECGSHGVPGVYASVNHGLCFIDWATKCGTGLPDIFEFQECETYAYDLYHVLTSKLQTTSNKRAKRKLKAALANFEQTYSRCEPGVVSGSFSDMGNQPHPVASYDNANHDTEQISQEVDGYVDNTQINVSDHAVGVVNY